MSIALSILPAFDHEMAATRVLLARVALDTAAWRPHPRSLSLGTLAAHIADIPRWTHGILNADGYDVSGSAAPAGTMSGAGALLATFDRNVVAARTGIGAASDDVLLGEWTLRHGDAVVERMTRAASLRVFVLHHLVHHRGQLTVYLRMRNVAVPALYGPSADTP